MRSIARHRRGIASTMRAGAAIGWGVGALCALGAWPPSPAAAIEGLPRGTPVLADGVIGVVEWQDARAIPVSLSATVSVTVLVKHDGTNLLAAYKSTLNPNRRLFLPELVVDPLVDRASSWQPDDWWFHISASDCEARGRWGDYSNCRIVQPDWIGVPNYPMNTPSPALIEEFELSIPLDKLGLSVGAPLGLALTVEFLPNERAIWPVGASMDRPATWAEVLLCDEACPATSTASASFANVKSLYK